jgi:hypothetical protein
MNRKALISRSFDLRDAAVQGLQCWVAAVRTRVLPANLPKTPDFRGTWSLGASAKAISKQMGVCHYLSVSTVAEQFICTIWPTVPLYVSSQLGGPLPSSMIGMSRIRAERNG